MTRAISGDFALFLAPDRGAAGSALGIDLAARQPAFRSRGSWAGLRALRDHVALELGEYRQHPEHGLAQRRRQIEAFLEAHEGHIVRLQFRHQVVEILGRAAEAIELPDHQRVDITQALLRIAQQFLQLRSVGVLAGLPIDVFFDHGVAVDPGPLAQGNELHFRILVALLLVVHLAFGRLRHAGVEGELHAAFGISRSWRRRRAGNFMGFETSSKSSSMRLRVSAYSSNFSRSWSPSRIASQWD